MHGGPLCIDTSGLHGRLDTRAGTSELWCGACSEAAMLLVSGRVPPLTLQDRTAAVYRAAEHALKHGEFRVLEF